MIPVKERPQAMAMRALFRTSARLYDSHKPLMAKIGMSISEFDLLAALGNTDGMQMSALAQHMITTPPNVTRVCQKMEKNGLVSRARSAESDRVVVACLTQEGQALFDKIFMPVVEFSIALVDQTLSTNEQIQLARLLNKMDSALQSTRVEKFIAASGIA